MKHYFDDVLRNGVLALEASKEPELFIIKVWTHLYVMDNDIEAELCTDTDLYIEIEEEPVFLITFTGSWLQMKPIGKEEDDLQSWYDKWSEDDRFHKVIGCIFLELKYAGDVQQFKLNPPKD